MIYPSKSIPTFILSFFLAYGLLSHGISENEPLADAQEAHPVEVIGYRISQARDQQNQADNKPDITIVVSRHIFNGIKDEQDQNRGNGFGPITVRALESFQNIFLRGEDISESYSSFVFAPKEEEIAA